MRRSLKPAPRQPVVLDTLWVLVSPDPHPARAVCLLRDDGQLELACFDASGQAVIQETITFASRRHHTLVGRRHLLYGLLQEADGVLPDPPPAAAPADE